MKINVLGLKMGNSEVKCVRSDKNGLLMLITINFYDLTIFLIKETSNKPFIIRDIESIR